MRGWYLRIWLALILLGVPASAWAADRYVINQTFGDIGFTVRHLGLFSSHGGFHAWDGELTISPEQPERSQVDVTIHAPSVYMPAEDTTALLRSPDYFNVLQYPEIHFVSTKIGQVAQNRYLIHGTLTIRGINQPQDFDANLIDRHLGPDLQSEIAEFLVTGRLQRSLFGMTADQTFVSDAIELTIRIRLRLGEALRAN